MAHEEALLALTAELLREVRPGFKRSELTLDSKLGTDLGIDSLSRVELMLRIEKAFKRAVPEKAAAEAETLRDLLKALEAAGPIEVAATLPVTAPVSDTEIDDAPPPVATLVELLEWRAKQHGDRVHIRLLEEGDQHQDITYAMLWAEAGEIAAGLQEHGLAAQQPVAMMLQTCREYFATFFGILRAGGIPVPLYPPAKATQIEEHVRRQAKILLSTQAPFMIASEEARRPASLVKTLVPNLREIFTPADLRRKDASPQTVVKPTDIALLQYTSGSTGDPKGVTLTHANLIANIRAMGEASGINPRDVFVSWLPLYHDMGLIGAWFGSLWTGARAVLMSPLLFLNRPQRWLRTMSRERGTVSAAPNFAYDLCATRLPDGDLEGLDLAPWRLAFNGAEAVRAETLERFAARFARCGFRREALMPVYGLAENCLGVTFPPVGRGPKIDRVRRDDLLGRRHATPATADDPTALTFVACGAPLPHHEIRIVDDSGRECGDREHGRLQFRGPSATRGYYRNPEATRQLLDGDWRNTGDLAYIANGDLFPAGRAKDLIIKGGRNILPTEIEEAVTALPGVRRGCVAVFGSPDPRTGTERVIVVAETAHKTPEDRAALEKRIVEAVTPLLEGPPDVVVLAPPRTVPKTPSGKIRRSAAREIFERGDFGRAPRSATLQVVRLALSAVGPEIARFFRVARAVAFGVRAWLVFAVLLPIAWITAVPCPGLTARRAIVRFWTRWALRFMGLFPETTGLEKLPKGPSIIVANHSSYLDALVLTAALPPRFGFVIKRELKWNPILGPLLWRLGAVFVDRFDPSQSVQDTEGVAGAAQAGKSLVIFPEGTFTRAPGLRPFRMGAFVAAAQAGVPVVPVGIRGTRSALRDGTWMVRRAGVGVGVGEPTLPLGQGWGEAIHLKDSARGQVLEGTGETDLRPCP